MKSLLQYILAVLVLIAVPVYAKKEKQPSRPEEYRFWPPYEPRFYAEPQEWNPADHVIDGWDWSLPYSCRPSARARITTTRTPISGFPASITRKPEGTPLYCGTDLGMYLSSIPGLIPKQIWTPDGYLETVKPDGQLSGSIRNFGYDAVKQFGETESFPFRYWASLLRAVQMQLDILQIESFTLNPNMLNWVSHELGRTAEDSPDAWCALRENTIQSGDRTGPLKNFERWLYQRDSRTYKTTPAVAVPHAVKMPMVPKGEVFDYIARSSKKFGFAIDDRFLFGPAGDTVIKITYHDIGNSRIQLLCLDQAGKPLIRSAQCTDSGKLKTASFTLKNADFSGTGMDHDFVIRATSGEAVLSMVRIIKL